MKDLRSQLLLNVTSLSSHRRRYTSAVDNRPSAVASGVTGIIAVVVFGLIILLSDLTGFYCTGVNYSAAMDC